MGTLRLFAVAIREVRQISRADPALAGRLREIAVAAFPTSIVPARGLLDRLGPVLREPPGATIIRPDAPSGSDLTALLTGAPVPADRLPACWRLVEVWLTELGWGSLSEPVDEAGIWGLDRILTRAGVPPRLGLHSQLSATLDLPLSPFPGLRVGWLSGPGTIAMAAAWRAAAPELADAAPISNLLGWLDQFELWNSAAAAVARPAPDLIAISQP